MVFCFLFSAIDAGRLSGLIRGFEKNFKKLLAESKQLLTLPARLDDSNECRILAGRFFGLME